CSCKLILEQLQASKTTSKALKNYGTRCPGLSYARDINHTVVDSAYVVVSPTIGFEVNDIASTRAVVDVKVDGKSASPEIVWRATHCHLKNLNVWRKGSCSDQV